MEPTTQLTATVRNLLRGALSCTVRHEKAKQRPLYTDKEVERVFRRWLRANEPKTMRLLEGTWNRQRNQITQLDLLNASVNGTLTPRTLKAWQDEYANFINTRMAPIWAAAAQSGASFINGKIASRFGPDVRFRQAAEKIEEWVVWKSGRLVTNLTDTQRQATRQLLQHHILNDPLSPSELGKRLRPIVGLDRVQERAVRNRHAYLISQGFNQAQATAHAGRYAAKLNRQRAERIARNELATAFNQGQLAQITQNVDDGLLSPDVLKEWNTAEDERVCPICAPLNDADPIPIDDEFSSRGHTALVPPIHVMCRCTIIYQVDLSDKPDEDAGYRADPAGAQEFIEEEYGKYDRATDARPTGEFNERRFNQAAKFGTQEREDETGSRWTERDQRAMRQEMNNLMAEYKLPVNDVLSQDRRYHRDAGLPDWDRQSGNGRSAARLTSSSDMRLSYNGMHSTRNGNVDLARDRPQGVVDWANGRRAGRAPINRERGSMRTLVHETVHGSGRTNLSRTYRRQGVQLEEVSTELTARWIMFDKFGDNKVIAKARAVTGGYRGYVSGLESMVKRVSLSTGGNNWDPNSPDRIKRLAKGALSYKRSGKGTNWATNSVERDVTRFADSLADQLQFESDDKRRQWINAFRSDFNSNAPNWSV